MKKRLCRERHFEALTQNTLKIIEIGPKTIIGRKSDCTDVVNLSVSFDTGQYSGTNVSVEVETSFYMSSQIEMQKQLQKPS